MGISNQDREAYHAMAKEKRRFATTKQGVIHIHTPASYDYALIKSVERAHGYTTLTLENIYGKCCDICGFVSESFPTAQDFCNSIIVGIGEHYKSEQEAMAYICLAIAIYVNELDFVAVTDHNTIEGCKRLECALEWWRKVFPGRKYHHVEVIYGVEISCADRMHSVVLYDKADKQAEDKLRAWLHENLFSEQGGTSKTSLDVISTFSGDSYIAYVAHINSANFFRSEYFTLSYKKDLLEFGEYCILGLSDIAKQDITRQKVWEIEPHRECIFLLDNDAHDIDSLAVNKTYLMDSQANFKRLKTALADEDICLRYEPINQPAKCIHSMFIVSEQKGFFYDKDKPTGMAIPFSPNMNCLIGSRGTGKSTMSEMLSLMIGGRVDDKAPYPVMLSHETVYLLFSCDGQEYMSCLYQPELDDNVDSSFDQIQKNIERSDNHGGKWRDKHPDGKYCDYIQQNLIEVYRVVSEGKWEKLNKPDRMKVFAKMSTSVYSMNDLLARIENRQFSSYLYSFVTDGTKWKKRDRFVRFGSTKLANDIRRLERDIDERMIECRDRIEKFNAVAKTIRIKMSEAYDPGGYIDLLFDRSNYGRSKIKGYDVFERDVEDYFEGIISSMGIVGFVKTVSSRHVDMLIANSMSQLLHATEDRSGIYPMRHQLDDNEVKGLVSGYVTIWNDNEWQLFRCLQKYYQKACMFTIEFDVNADKPDESPAFRDIACLSMGQKVTALLTFIIEYSYFRQDRAPLILDQPEDNLDGKYIYNTLVKTFRGVKSERQLIIATHNATIVTNTKSEQVLVLESENNHARVKHSGFPSDCKIAESVLQILEGGKDSFFHRNFIYRNSLYKDQK